MSTNLNSIVTKITYDEDVSNTLLQQAIDQLSARFDNLINTIYPIGSIYTSVNNVDPSAVIGGVWEKIKDRFLLCSGDSYTNGSVGGEASHTLSQSEIPAHTHNKGTMEITGFFSATVPQMHGNTPAGAFKGASRSAGYNGASYMVGSVSANTPIYGYDFTASSSWTGETSSVGEGAAHNNMPPYLVVNVWKRVA